MFLYIVLLICILLFSFLFLLFHRHPCDGFEIDKKLLAVYAQFKNEGHILNEWIDHHLREGADHIFLVDNDSTDNYNIDPDYSPFITLYKIDTPHSQIENGQRILDIIKNEYKWVLVIDLDEFVYTRNYPSLRDFLLKSEYENPQTMCLCIPWKMFGSSGFTKQPHNVIHHFLYRDLIDTTFKRGRNFKSLFRSWHARFNIHIPSWDNQEYKNPPYTCYVFDPTLTASPNGIIPSDIIISEGEIALNHYAIQSREFFNNIKMTRGSAATPLNDHVRTQTYFLEYDKNIVYDDELSIKRKKPKNKPWLVMTRYKESVDFIDYNPSLFDHFENIYIYNKGLSDIRINRYNVFIIPSIKLGDADESFLRFILDSYDEPDRVVVFASASLFCYPNPFKEKKFLFTLDRVLSIEDSVICVHPNKQRYDWVINSYRQTGLENKIYEKSLLTPCVFRPFGRWVEEVIGIPFDKLQYISHHGVFSVSSRHWRNRSKQFYHKIHQRLMQPHPEENHYLERTWAYLFRVNPHNMLIYDNHFLRLKDLDSIERRCII